ncbi:uncharacterized protein LOC124409087 [Diprion similis]|uniref:uncharacterized protein LOC124409087 n=1 Tax=Diprion similis TaxID=362088 RepID=UPI001EF9B203|nr:uncharacterized protein LOC124409087 [Diprion similis]
MPSLRSVHKSLGRELTTPHHDVSTQTSPDKTSLEVIQLKEELQLLQKRVDRLLQTHLEKQPDTATSSPKTTKKSGKGCACKGKCINKPCGCVKKEIPCGEFCKYKLAKCQNKESNKENIANPNVQATLAGVADHVSSNLSVLTLKDNHQTSVMGGAVGPSNENLKNLAKAAKSIFSPDTSTAYEDELPSDNVKLNATFQFGDSKKNLSYRSDSSPDDRFHPTHTRTNNAAKNPEKIFGKPPIREDSDDDVELSIDPMKPTRQLPRTPVSGSPQSFRLELSVASISCLQNETKEEPILPPEDFNAPVVNFEKLKKAKEEPIKSLR